MVTAAAVTVLLLLLAYLAYLASNHQNNLPLSVLPSQRTAGSGSYLGIAVTPGNVEPASVSQDQQAGPVLRDILVLYMYSTADPEYLHNLRYFVRQAVQGDWRSEYVILLNEADEVNLDELPKLPPHARYLVHPDDCFDWGTYGRVLDPAAGHVGDLERYAYVFMVASSVRGPFVPPYLKPFFPWWQPFLSRLSSTTLLVGSSISCEEAPLDPEDEGAPWRSSPHVQSHAMAMNQAGLKLLQADGNVFKCHGSLWETVYHAELGASAAVLQAGYSIDSLLLRYQGVDWADPNNWACNGRLSPSGEFAYDGIHLDPYEAVFVKVRSLLVEQHQPAAEAASKYDFWLHDADPEERVNANMLVADAPRIKLPKILEKIARGEDCFDFAFYLRRNPDLDANETRSDLWNQFVYFGQFEPRQYRFTCPMNYSRFAGLAVQQSKGSSKADG